MQVVLSAHHLSSIGGVPTYSLTLAEQLERLGHEVTLFALEQGEMADLARRGGLVVAAGESDLPAECDVVIAQDGATALLLAERYPRAPQVFVVHGEGHDLMLPPQGGGAPARVVVMNDRVGRRVEALAQPQEVVRLRQPLDLKRFQPVGVIREKPRHVLLLGNYLRGPQRDLLVAVVERLGMSWEQIGAHGRADPRPEQAILEADIVVGIGRSALEAMASGRATYLFDHKGGDGWITPESYPVFEADGFNGHATDRMLDEAAIAEDLRGYRAEMGAVNAALAQRHHGAGRHGSEFSKLLVELVPRVGGPPPLARELARLVRTEWRADGRAIAVAQDNQVLRERLEQQGGEAHELAAELYEARLAAERAEAAAARASSAEHDARHRAELAEKEADRARGDLGAFQATRRYRFAAGLGQLLDSVRGRDPR